MSLPVWNLGLTYETWGSFPNQKVLQFSNPKLGNDHPNSFQYYDNIFDGIYSEDHQDWVPFLHEYRVFGCKLCFLEEVLSNSLEPERCKSGVWIPKMAKMGKIAKMAKIPKISKVGNTVLI